MMKAVTRKLFASVSVMNAHGRLKRTRDQAWSLASSIPSSMYSATLNRGACTTSLVEICRKFPLGNEPPCRNSLQPVACKHAIAFGRKKGMTNDRIASTYCQSDILLSNVSPFYACIGPKPAPVDMVSLAIRETFKRPLAIRRGPGAPKKNRYKRKKFNDTTQHAPRTGFGAASGGSGINN